MFLHRLDEYGNKTGIVNGLRIFAIGFICNNFRHYLADLFCNETYIMLAVCFPVIRYAPESLHFFQSPVECFDVCLPAP